MAGDAALDIFPQIQSLVSDKFQVVSYKWLSRHFSMSSNCAKRLLHEFAEKHHSELEVLYTLSGWLKSDPRAYCIKLASSLKLAEAKKEFQDSCSVQVYSVQASIPPDLAMLWNTEFVQAEELFNQPLTEENCLRDNRFCGVSNSFVKRILDSKNLQFPTSRPTVGVSSAGESIGRNTTKLQPTPLPHKSLVGHSTGQHEMQPSNAVLCEKGDKSVPVIVEKATKPTVPKESTASGNTNKRKAHDEKTSSETAGSLASLWGRAKPKSTGSSDTANLHPVAAGTAEAIIRAQEAVDASSDEDEEHNVICKRESNGQRSRKRKVVLDFSDNDEEEDVVSLVSPEPPNEKRDTEYTNEILSVGRENFKDEQKGDILKCRLADIEERNIRLIKEPDERHDSEKVIGGISLLEKTDGHNKEGADIVKKDQAVNSVSTLPKGKKVLKTRIDDRGREVTEVVWEGPAESNQNKNDVTNDGNRSSTSNKTHVTPATAAVSNPAAKGANKKPAKGGPKDAKQGNILSFFKRV